VEISDLDLADVRAFFLVVETGGFARAAHRLEASKAAISRRVSRLEETLSALLLQRTQSGAVLTEAGQVFYDAAQAAMSHFQHAVESLHDVQTETTGSIRITVPMHLGTFVLSGMLCDFMRDHPGIELDVHMSDDKLDLVRTGFDLAVRTGYLPDSGLVHRHLADSRRVLVASPGYLESHPAITAAQDAQAHHVLHYTTLNTHELWKYKVDGEWRQFPVIPWLRSNSGAVLIRAAVQGLGLTVMPVYIAGPYLATGELVEVLPQVDWDTTPINLLIPAGRRMTRRVRTLVEYLVMRFREM